MKILFFGQKDCPYSTNAFEFLKLLNYEITAVWSISRDERMLGEILSQRWDYIFCFRSYLKIPKVLLDNTNVAINFHQATPEYPGSGGAAWALYNNSKYFGVTSHLINEHIDNGRILKVKRFKISRDDNLKSLIDRASSYAIIMFYEIIEDIFYNKKSVDEMVTTEEWNGQAKKISEINQLKIIDLDINSDDLNRKVRAFHTEKYPVTLMLHGKKFVLMGD